MECILATAPSRDFIQLTDPAQLPENDDEVTMIRAPATGGRVYGLTLHA
jgi:hypothetical protein